MSRSTAPAARGLLRWCAVALFLAGCAAPIPAEPPAALADLVRSPPGLDFLLLGEVHDNPEHHRQRLGWLESLARSGRFALALEQFDADRQPAIDAAVAAGLDARALARSAGFDFDGWDWKLYAPYVELALRHGLPLVAANLSTAQTRTIARAPAAAAPAAIPAGWGAAEDAALEAEISDGHCGLLPVRAIAPMAAAQRARDARIATALVEARRATGLPVVLIAGNGHVRRDIGVPRHLAGLTPQARVLAIGFLERSTPPDERALDAAEPFDRVVGTAPHPRPDPCESLRKAFGQPKG